jgi:DNA polymerase-3 subunit delta'
MGWTVVGQDHALAVLTAAVKHGRIAHAYLFAGPARVGKSLAAMQFAQLLNCTGGDVPLGGPCGECRSCERIASGAHPDVEFVGIGGLCKPKPGESKEHDHASDNSRDIRICQVRRVEEIISRAPFLGAHRVIIFQPAEALGRDAIPALLKTLEEPPPYVVFILVTDHEDLLLDTVRSRARRVAFAGQPRDLIERVLRTRCDADPEQAARLARLAGGRLGLAVAALRDEKLLESREAALDKIEALAQSRLTERFAAASTLGGGYTRDRAGVQATLELWQEWWRDVLLAAAARPDSVTHIGRLDTLRALAAQCDVPAAVRALRAITGARQQLVENASPVLALEAMMLALPVLRPNAVTTRLRG